MNELGHMNQRLPESIQSTNKLDLDHWSLNNRKRIKSSEAKKQIEFKLSNNW